MFFHRRSLLTLLFGLFLLSGCMRYVAPRSELSQLKGEKVDLTDPGVGIEGSASFSEFQDTIESRVSSLIKSREHLLAKMGDTSYKIGSGDVLTLDVFGLPELSTEAEVGQNGMVMLPLVGDVLASGKSLLQFKNYLTGVYSRFVKHPKVLVNLKEYKANKIYIVGEVAKPGTYPLKNSGEQILELISEAGGKTDKAGGRIILIPGSIPSSMNEAGSSQVASNAGIEIEMDTLIGNVNIPPVRIPLISGDTIIIPEAGKVEVYGEVEKPGSYSIASRTSALGAVATAGGFTYAAKVDEVELIRDFGGGKKASLVLNLEDIALKGVKDLRIRDGDIIRVPSASGLFAKRQIVEAINSLFKGVSLNGRAN